MKTHEVKFNLKEELAKGDHILEMPALFPTNAEFKKLVNYKTPQNSTTILAFFYLNGGFFIFSSLFFIKSFFRNKKAVVGMRSYNNIKLLLFALNAILLCYIMALLENKNIFYFPAPYQDYKFSMLNIAAYIPFLMLLLIIPLFRINLKIFKEPTWHIFSKCLFLLNNLTYLILIIFFAYWGL